MEPHKLTELDRNNRTAVCSVCGPTIVYWKGKNKFRCKSKHGAYRLSPRERRNLKLMDLYGITIEEFDFILETQKDLCPICLEPDLIVLTTITRQTRLEGFFILAVI